MPPVGRRPVELHGDSARLPLLAIRGRAGDWAFYTCILPFSEISHRVGFASEMRRSQDLGDIIQRALRPNAARIAAYLVKQPQRFLSSLVIAVDDSEPRFHELAVGTLSSRVLRICPNSWRNMGVLELRGDERLIAIDGQHRVRGISDAVADHNRLANDQVTVILVRHDETPAGIQRTRRLFTTLNRYAKPVSKRDLIAQDEDDVVAIVVRDVLDAEPLLRTRVSGALGSSLATTDRRSITTLPALYDSLDLVLRDRSRSDWSRYKRFRPPDGEIKSRFAAARAFWRELVSSIEVLQLLQRSADLVLGPEHRGPEGGHVLLRPIGLVAVASATRLLMTRAGP